MNINLPLSTITIGLSLAMTGCFNHNSDASLTENQPSPNIDGVGATVELGGYAYYFEDAVVPPAVTSTPGSLSVSNLRYKDGSQSLRWEFTPDAVLTLHQDIGYTNAKELELPAKPQTFIGWIYNEKPIDGYMTFEFGEDGSTATHFRYNMNFQGWRGISVPFHDMEGTPTESMNRIRVLAPSNAEGVVHFDQIMPSVHIDNRHSSADFQQPFVNSEAITLPSKNWMALLEYNKLLTAQYVDFDYSEDFSEEGRLDEIYKKFDFKLGINPEQTISKEDIDKNLANYSQFEITINDDGIMSSKPVDTPNRFKFMSKDVVVPETKKRLQKDTVSIQTLGQVMLSTAKILTSNSLSDEDRARLEDQFILAYQYSLDHGFQYGSGLQTVTHLGYRTREYFDSLYIMRMLLAKRGLLKQAQQAMMWYSATGRIFQKDQEIISSNADILNTQLSAMIKSILLLPNQVERAEMMSQFSEWLSKTLLASDGTGGGFKPDGSVFHHHQHYMGYGKGALDGASEAIYVLSGSEFAITSEAHQRIKTALMNASFYSKVDTKGKLLTPIALSGRHPNGKQAMKPGAYKWLALAGTVDGSNDIDPDLASIYEMVSGDSSLGEYNAAEPKGSLVMNYATMGVLRGEGVNREDGKTWTALARGFNRYVVGNETYSNANLYGRYNLYGCLELVPSDLSQQAFSHDGWDWNRYPGTTAIHLPNEELRATLNQLEGAGLEEMLLSTETYAGASKLDDQSAMFAMKLHGHKKYNQQGLTANKSYFMYDDTIVAMGSNINSNDTNHDTETTLFQHSIGARDNLKPIEVNGNLVDTLGLEETLTGEVSFRDPANNLYFISAEEQKIKLSYKEQQSNNQNDGKPNNGNFATAVIDHGKAPQSAAYRYVIKMDAPEGALKPTYTEIVHSNKVHAVKWASGVEAYAFFEPSTIDDGQVLVESADTPSQLMVKSTQQNTLMLSVMNPDLGLYDGEDPDQVDENGDQVEVSIYSRDWAKNKVKAVETTFTLRGTWDIGSKNPNIVEVEHHDGNTTITTSTTHATPLVFELTAAL
ncbi:TPA: chondroitinase family polysaccharide lyase [Vibrio parahaemolyticus]